MKDPLIVVGVVGPARSGKDTVAKILELHGGFTRVALADPIKDAFDRLGGPQRETHKELGGFNGQSIRRAWQLFGTEAREDVGRLLGLHDSPTLWVDVALTTICYAERHHAVRRHRFVIPDVRYKHEHDRLSECVEKLGGHYESWLVSREVMPTGNHSSETSYPDVPTSTGFMNVGTIPDLVRLVVAEMEALIGG